MNTVLAKIAGSLIVSCQPVPGGPLDRTAFVAKIAPRFFADRSTYFSGQSGKCLTGGPAAAFEGSVKGIKRRQHECMRDSVHVDIGETRLDKQRLQPRLVA